MAYSWSITHFPSPFPSAPPPSFIKENRRCPTAIILGIDRNLFLEHDYGSCYDFPPGEGGLHFAKCFFFFVQKKKCDHIPSACAQDALALLLRSWATCKHTKRHLWGRHFGYTILFDFSHGLGFLVFLSVAPRQKWKIWIYFILGFFFSRFFCILKYPSPSCDSLVIWKWFTREKKTALCLCFKWNAFGSGIELCSILFIDGWKG